MLTLLWILDAWSCSAMTLSTAISRYTEYQRFRPKKQFAAELKHLMLSRQIEVLQRCNWHMQLDAAEDLAPARAQLEAELGFREVCAAVNAECDIWDRKTAWMKAPLKSADVNVPVMRRAGPSAAKSGAACGDGNDDRRPRVQRPLVSPVHRHPGRRRAGPPHFSLRGKRAQQEETHPANSSRTPGMKRARSASSMPEQ